MHEILGQIIDRGDIPLHQMLCSRIFGILDIIRWPLTLSLTSRTYLVRAFQSLPKWILLSPILHTGRAKIELLRGRQVIHLAWEIPDTRRAFTSRRSVFLAVVSAPSFVYPRKDGELIILERSLTSAGRSKSFGRLSWV